MYIHNCKNCAKSWPNTDCGHHFKGVDGSIMYSVHRESACDRWGDCMFFEETRNRFEIQLDIMINSGRPFYYSELDLDVLVEALRIASKFEKNSGD